MGEVGLKYWDLLYELSRINNKRDKYDTWLGDRIRSLVDKSLECRVAVDQESILEAANDEDSTSSSDSEDDPVYMSFLSNLKPDGKSYVLKAGDQNGVPLFVKYEREDESDDDHEYDGLDKDQELVKKKYKVGSSEALKTTVRKNRNTSKVEKQKKDGILSQKQGREYKDLGKRKLSNNVKILPRKEQKTRNRSKFMDKGVKMQSKEDSDSLVKEIPQGEVEILQNVDASSSSNPFVPSVGRCQNLEDPCRSISNPSMTIDSGYRKEVLTLLMRPYDEQEYKKLWKDIKMQISSSSTNGRRSLLSLHKGVNRAIKRTNHDKDKKLNIMRGFFFWLEHLTREDAFWPWEDAECLRTMPGSS